MKICLISDWHLGITNPKAIDRTIEKMKCEEFDVLVNAGDTCGTYNGVDCVKELAEKLRAAFPDKPMIWTLGNHDYWCTANPTMSDFDCNLNGINDCLGAHHIDFIDRGLMHLDGVYFIGASGWYTNPHPHTNDGLYLPKTDDEGFPIYMNKILLEGSNATIELQLKYLDSILAEKGVIDGPIVFISHFPVINAGNDYKGAFEDWSWSEEIGKKVQEYGCKHFLNGHAHQFHNGPLRYECGSDYMKPAYLIIEV